MNIKTYLGRDIKLRHLRLLVAIDEAGQLSKAARLLHLTQPALSKALAEVERGLGEPLFERTAKGLVANVHGAALIRAGRNVLTELDRVGGEIRDLGDRPARVLLVGAMPTASMSFLGRAIALMAQRDPGLTVRVTEGLTEHLLSQLVMGRLHLVAGARLRESVPGGVKAHWLFDDPMCMIVSPQHPLARRQAPSWEVCAAQPWVLPSPGHPIRSAFDTAVHRAGFRAPATVLEGLDVGLILPLLRHTHAINLMPTRLAKQLQGDGLVHILGGENANRLGLHLATTTFVSEDAGNSGDQNALLDCLRKVVSTQRLGTDLLN